MMKNILLPTDGTPFCEKAIRYGVALAKASGASVTGVTVTAPMRKSISEGLSDTIREAIAANRKLEVDAALATVTRIASDSGVACSTIAMEDEHVYQGIIDAAKAKGCDLIVMASHGRRGLAAVVVGSETQKVLTHSTVPVLVCR